MFCTKCGKEVDETNNKFCPGCGTSIGADPNQANVKQTKPKKPLYKKPWFIAIAAIVVIVAISSMGKKPAEPAQTTGLPATDPTLSESSSKSTEPESKASEAASTVALESVDLELTNGNYTAGIDLPVGKYDITWISGAGNVMSNNLLSGGINAIFGPNDGSGLYQQEYKNISITDECVLSIQNVTVRLVCEKPKSGVVQRKQPNTETILLGNGNFVSGTDFPAGVYTIQAVSGNGNVSSDNLLDGGINSIMGVDNDEIYQKEYKNINLPEGVTISISGVSINLVPSL